MVSSFSRNPHLARGIRQFHQGGRKDSGFGETVFRASMTKEFRRIDGLEKKSLVQP
jgi:hypothetical protein